MGPEVAHFLAGVIENTLLTQYSRQTKGLHDSKKAKDTGNELQNSSIIIQMLLRIYSVLFTILSAYCYLFRTW